MNARFFVPGIGRFASADTIVPDPANPQSLNRYAYSLNNPVNYVDPSGHYAANVNGSSLDCYDQHQCQNSYIPSSEDAIYPEGFENSGYHVGYEPTHAAAVGASANISLDTPLVGMEAQVGIESVTHMYTGENTTFLILGGGVKVGPNEGFFSWMKRSFKSDDPNPFNASASAYVARVENVRDLVTDYSGIFEYGSKTVSPGYGVTWGESHVPRDTRREKAYSEFVGLSKGYSLTVNAGAAYYIPLKTQYPGRFPNYHNPFPYLWDMISGIGG
jgi:hypothetical protein